MSSHPITEPMRQLTLRALRNKGITKKDLSDQVGLWKAWVTKFLDGSIRTMKLETMQKVEDALGISYFSSGKLTEPKSPLALKIASMVDADPTFAKLAYTKK